MHCGSGRSGARARSCRTSRRCHCVQGATLPGRRAGEPALPPPAAATAAAAAAAAAAAGLPSETSSVPQIALGDLPATSSDLVYAIECPSATIAAFAGNRSALALPRVTHGPSAREAQARALTEAREDALVAAACFVPTPSPADLALELPLPEASGASSCFPFQLPALDLLPLCTLCTPAAPSHPDACQSLASQQDARAEQSQKAASWGCIGLGGRMCAGVDAGSAQVSTCVPAAK